MSEPTTLLSTSSPMPVPRVLVPQTRFFSENTQREPVRIILLGSTGSIGQSTLDIVEAHPDRFHVVGLAAGSNAELLAEQVEKFQPAYAAMASVAAAEKLRTLVSSEVEVLAGEKGVAQLAQIPGGDLVVAAVVGFAGIEGVLAALEIGRDVALANKESLVVAGSLVQKACEKSGASILPVDSEHSALFQALQGESLTAIAELTLTASGGPFLKTPKEELLAVTPEQAVQHPRWSMGPKISVDSATLMNKALECIEAHWLFGVPADRIGVVVHPQSIVHSLVRFVDGSSLAQLSHPDMKGPIAYALGYAHGRFGPVTEPLSLADVGTLEFLPLDNERFPAVALARKCIADGGVASAVFNIANELAVAAFLEEKLVFVDIFRFVEQAVARLGGQGDISSLADLSQVAQDVEAFYEQWA